MPCPRISSSRLLCCSPQLLKAHTTTPMTIAIVIHEVDWVVFVLVVICCVISFESKFPAKGAVLEGGEEGVQFGEVGALRGLLALNGFDDGGEFLLEGEWGECG